MPDSFITNLEVSQRYQSLAAGEWEALTAPGTREFENVAWYTNTSDVAKTYIMRIFAMAQSMPRRKYPSRGAWRWCRV